MIQSLLNSEELLRAVKGSKIEKSPAECFFTDVQTDSRNIAEKGQKNGPCMFVPLVGENQDGHKYIPSVLDGKKNVGVILLNESEYNSKPEFYNELAEKNPTVFFVKVLNTLHALQDAAEAYAQKKCADMIKISITGSSGKTTTKEMMVAVCKSYYGEESVAYTKGNFNSETGLPLSVFQIRGDEKVCILEMGMNRVNEIGEISKVFKSKYGIITNIGTAHIGILGSQENIAREKRKSFDYIPQDGAVFVNAADPFADFCTENVIGKIVKFGKAVPASECGVQFLEDKGLFGTDFLVDGIKVNLALSGEYNYLNALSVIACAKEIGIPAQKIKEGLESMRAIPGRMEICKLALKSGKNIIGLKDCYNANLDSMQKVLEFCRGLKNIGKKIFILADMKELGNESLESHKKIGKLVKEIKPDYAFFVGEEMKAAYEICNGKNIVYYETNSEEYFKKISEKIISVAEENDLVLLKGSHSMHLENIIPLLSREGV